MPCPSGVRSRIGTRISSRKRCAPVVSTPARASSTAGSNSVAHGSRPCCPCASARPATRPGTATDDGPTWKTCVEASPKSITTSSIGPCGREGTAKKQSSSVGSPPGSRRSRKPPPDGPVNGPSATNAANAAATTASTALPPAARAHAPASAVCRLPAATAPRMVKSLGKRLGRRRHVRELHGFPAFRVGPRHSRSGLAIFLLAAPGAARAHARDFAQAKARACRGTGCGPDADSHDETALADGGDLAAGPGRPLREPLAAR